MNLAYEPSEHSVWLNYKTMRGEREIIVAIILSSPVKSDFLYIDFLAEGNLVIVPTGATCDSPRYLRQLLRKWQLLHTLTAFAQLSV